MPNRNKSTAIAITSIAATVVSCILMDAGFDDQGTGRDKVIIGGFLIVSPPLCVHTPRCENCLMTDDGNNAIFHYEHQTPIQSDIIVRRYVFYITYFLN